MEFASYASLLTSHCGLECFHPQWMTKLRERHMPGRNAYIKGLQNFIPTALQRCPKLTLKQENRLNGAFITRFHNLLFDSSWWYKVWSLLDLSV